MRIFAFCIARDNGSIAYYYCSNHVGTVESVRRVSLRCPCTRLCFLRHAGAEPFADARHVVHPQLTCALPRGQMSAWSVLASRAPSLNGDVGLDMHSYLPRVEEFRWWDDALTGKSLGAQARHRPTPDHAPLSCPSEVGGFGFVSGFARPWRPALRRQCVQGSGLGPE